jgi:uncharacterized protein (TIGR01244 family)
MKHDGDPADIVGWQRLDARTTTSGRLEPGDPARLAGIGVRRVINLALAESPGALPDEAALLAAAGIDYTHIPVPFDAPGDAQFVAFRQSLEADETPVHVHCIMNWRVSAFFYRFHKEQGMPEEQARAAMAVQWDPDTNPSKDAPAWARFIRGGA